jgi:hypothetical protein
VASPMRTTFPERSVRENRSLTSMPIDSIWRRYAFLSIPSIEGRGESVKHVQSDRSGLSMAMVAAVIVLAIIVAILVTFPSLLDGDDGCTSD